MWRKPRLTADGNKVIPYGKTEADAITIRNKGNMDADGYVTAKNGQRLKYDEDGFPIYESKYDMHVSDDLIGNRSPDSHFRAANESLSNKLRDNPNLAREMGLSNEQVNHIIMKIPPSNESPRGLTWHHHQDLGKMQLVDREIHGTFKHTGGMSIWGGGY